MSNDDLEEMIIIPIMTKGKENKGNCNENSSETTNVKEEEEKCKR